MQELDTPKQWGLATVFDIEERGQNSRFFVSLPRPPYFRHRKLLIINK